MTLEQIIQTLSKKQNGSWVKVELLTEMTSRQTSASKKANIVITKKTVTTVRKGVRYSSIASVKERLDATGNFYLDPQTGKKVYGTQKLPWGSWYRNSKTIIEHKGNYYARLYTSPNRPLVTYYINGKEISTDDLRKSGVMQESYWKNKDNKDSVSADECMTVKIENIQRIY